MRLSAYPVQYKNTPGVTADEIPEQLKILDKNKGVPANAAIVKEMATGPATTAFAAAHPALSQPVVAKHQQIHNQVAAEHKPRDYPSVRNWLETLHDDMERGRDGFNYRSLLPVFESNDVKRLDDVNTLGYQLLKEIVKDAQVEASIGLLNRIVRYAQEDVSYIGQQ